MDESCAACGGPVKRRFNPMERWGIEGPLCGKCYSEKIAAHYPGEHVRMGSDSG